MNKDQWLKLCEINYLDCWPNIERMYRRKNKLARSAIVNGCSSSTMARHYRNFTGTNCSPGKIRRAFAHAIKIGMAELMPRRSCDPRRYKIPSLDVSDRPTVGSIIDEYYSDAQQYGVRAYRMWQYKLGNSGWRDCTKAPEFNHKASYRRKPS